MQHKPTIDDLIKKLEGCLQEAGFCPETRRSTTGAVIAARLSADVRALRVVAQIEVGEPAIPEHHGAAARELVARHAVNIAIRPTLGARAAAAKASAGGKDGADDLGADDLDPARRR